MKAAFVHACLLCVASLFAEGTNVAVIATLPDLPAGYTALRVDTLGFCIASLPQDNELQALPQSRSEFLKRILGGTENRHTTVWEASITFSYHKTFRLLYVLTSQGGLGKQEPIFREIEASAAVTETIAARPDDSDFFAFSSPRRYYFDTAAKAEASALRHAQNRLAALRPLLCAPR